jgi:outer membrane protein assembly factor BamB
MQRSRRTLLASVATAALAGCTGDTPSDETDPAATTDQTTGRTSSTEPTATSRPEPEQPASVDTDWPMPAADHGLSNASLDTVGPMGEVAELWGTDIGTELSGPTLVDGTLYVAGDDLVRAFDARDGTEQWQRSVGSGAGTPWVVDEGLVVPTDDGIVSLGTDGQTERWRVETPTRAAFLVAPHGVYYVRDGDAPELVQLALSDGGEQWRADLDEGVEPPSWTPPVFASDDLVYVPTGTHARVPWQFDPESGSYVGDTELRDTGRGHHFPGERCYLDGAVYAADPFYGDLWAFEATPETYEQRWGDGLDDPGGDLLASDGERLFARNRRDGRLHGVSLTGGADWASAPIGELVARPVVTDETVLALTEERLYCFDPTDGNRLWDRSADGIGTEFVVADDILFTTDGGTLRAFRSV